jgi:hypothetical protein
LHPDPKSQAARILRRLKRLKKSFVPRKEFLKKWAALRNALYKTAEYQCFLHEVRIRASYMCVRGCGKKGRHVHHKIRVYDDPDLSLDPDNGEFLCIACHRKEHKK